MRKRRSGFTLLELMIATTMLTVSVTSVGLILRTGHGAWRAQRDDAQRLEVAQAALRHVARRVRFAESVTAITSPSNQSGSLSLLMPDGQTYVWSRNGSNSQLLFGIDSADQLLAEDITGFSFTGYETDGQAATTVPADIQAIKCQVTVTLPRETGGDRSLSCYVTLRTF
jgi:prepilin-type N-terminal cleavage/methylation domain-containing protein